MKRVVFIHGWEGSPEEGWRPWVKRELEQKGFQVLNPAMPNPKYPKQKEWVEHLAEVIKTPDEETILIGHSLGAITILRYLESLPEGQKIGGAVFVAGFSDDLQIPEIKDFFTTEIKWDKVKQHCQTFIALHSDNDPYVPLTHREIFQDKLNAQVVTMHNMRHFSGDDGIRELPQLLELILSI